jgi:quercetin dioxygenase-like cupin family protein
MPTITGGITMSAETSRTIPANETLQLAALVAYSEGAVVSRTLLKSKAGTVTLFAFDADQGLSEHAAPFDALVQVLDGRGEFTVGGQLHEVGSGEALLMPANIPHAVRAPGRFKMLLIMLR